MKKTIFTFLLVSLFLSSPVFAADPDIAKTDMSKSELCDFAIQALQELLKQSPDAAKNQPAITKEQCMAISDEDINNAAKKIMAGETTK
ncbi:MAG: hypothetical protein ACC657_17935 [Thiohalomonadales bacterium]